MKISKAVNCNVVSKNKGDNLEEYIDIKKYIKNEKIFECTEVGEYNENYYNIDNKVNESER